MLGLYEASSTKVYPKLFHIDYSGGLFYSASIALYYISFVLTLGAVSETAIVFFHVLALLLCSAMSYGCYIFTAGAFSPEVVAKMEGTGIIEKIVMSIFIGVTSSAMSLCGAFGALALMYHLCWRYRASPLGRFIARLPGIRCISYVHRKYWLPSGYSLRPRPRFFYLKRFIIRQSEFFLSLSVLRTSYITFHVGVKIPLNCILLCGIIVMLAYCLCLSFAVYSVFVNLLKESPWYGFFLFFLISIPVVASIVVCAAVAVHAGYKGTVDYFLEAWKDFTVDVEPGGVLDDEPFEGV